MLEHYEKDKELMDAVKRVAWNDMAMAMLRTRRYTPPAKSPTLDEAMDVIRKALDWNCPFCGEQNSTEKPDKVLQCTWCMKKVPAKLVE